MKNTSSSSPLSFPNHLDNWMGLMPEKLRLIPIINLAIPGSHDSMSYGINKASKAAPDAKSVIRRLNLFVPCVIRRWARTQYLRPIEQLQFGIRYFDLRICFKKSDGHFYFAHGLFCEKIREPLMEIVNYLNEHPKEFVILDCQHFYDLSPKDHERFIKEMLSTFGDKIYGQNDGRLNELTLNRAEQCGKQILIIYRYNFVFERFWSSDSWPTPWPNQINVIKLKKFLEKSLQQRTNRIGYVSQCVLTPPALFIVPRFYSSLRSKCADAVRLGLFDWIREQRPGVFSDNERATSNVFIADFIDLDEHEFCKIVVELNVKLL